MGVRDDVCFSWTEGATFRFNEEDKQMVRDNLLEAIVQSPPLIRSQLCETLKAVIYNDFPHQWPGLMPQIGNNLGTTEPPRLYGALYALRILANKYEFKDEEERQPIQEIVRVTFPHLLNIFQVSYARHPRNRIYRPKIIIGPPG